LGILATLSVFGRRWISRGWQRSQGGGGLRGPQRARPPGPHGRRRRREP